MGEERRKLETLEDCLLPVVPYTPDQVMQAGIFFNSKEKRMGGSVADKIQVGKARELILSSKLHRVNPAFLEQSLNYSYTNLEMNEEQEENSGEHETKSREPRELERVTHMVKVPKFAVFNAFSKSPYSQFTISFLHTGGDFRIYFNRGIDQVDDIFSQRLIHSTDFKSSFFLEEEPGSGVYVEQDAEPIIQEKYEAIDELCLATKLEMIVSPNTERIVEEGIRERTFENKEIFYVVELGKNDWQNSMNGDVIPIKKPQGHVLGFDSFNRQLYYLGKLESSENYIDYIQGLLGRFGDQRESSRFRMSDYDEETLTKRVLSIYNNQGDKRSYHSVANELVSSGAIPQISPSTVGRLVKKGQEYEKAANP